MREGTGRKGEGRGEEGDKENKEEGCYFGLNEVCKDKQQGLHDTAGGHALHLAQHGPQ